MALFNKTKEELLPEQFPEHIAFIMDGNGRWAKKRGLPRKFGHREGAKTFKKITRYCKDIGIKNITFYAFSTCAGTPSSTPSVSCAIASGWSPVGR